MATRRRFAFWYLRRHSTISAALSHRAAASACVLDFIVEVSHLAFGALKRNVGTKLWCNFGKSLRLFRFNLEHGHQDGGAEAGLQRCTDLALF